MLNIITNAKLRFYQEELFRTKRALFTVPSIRQIKNIQERIKYLQSVIKSIEKSDNI